MMHKPNLSTISITDLTGFSECRRQWWLSEYYEVKKPIVHFWIGNVVHAGLEGYYRSDRNFEAGMAALNKHAEESIVKIAKEFEFSWGDYSTEFDESLLLARNVFQNYCIFDYATPLEGQVFAAEQYIKIHVFDYLGKPVYVSGRIDLIMERERNRLWIIDHKTAKQRESSYAGLDVDEQLTGYAWLVWKKYGIIPTAVIYNVLIKDVPSAPRVLKDGSLSKDKSQSTVHDLYVEELARLKLDPGPYEDVLRLYKAAGWSRYFSREGSTRNLAELEAFEKNAILKVRDILTILTDPEEAYPTASTQKCGWCPFIGVCKSMNDGSDYQAILDSQFSERLW